MSVEQARELAPRIAVVIPCYDEAPTIRKVVEDFRKALPAAEVFVFDNNSRDGSAAIAGVTMMRATVRPFGRFISWGYRLLVAGCGNP